jgi:hypothetical protein
MRMFGYHPPASAKTEATFMNVLYDVQNCFYNRLKHVQAYRGDQVFISGDKSSSYFTSVIMKFIFGTLVAFYRGSSN